MKAKSVIIVGGGASGLVAAISAAREGANVTIIEQKDRLGKKILSTGNGKCNLTNEYMKTDCFRGDDTSIVSKVLDKFGYKDTCEFFESLGVILKNRQGYIYPISDQATTIVDILCMEVAHLNVNVVLNESVASVNRNKKGFVVKTNDNAYYGESVILATGGKASPVLGSDGSGYEIAKSFGHKISTVVPALVQLQGKGNFFKSISGVRTNATVSIYVDGELKGKDTGELQLTNYGISGIPVFQISRYAAKALHQKKTVKAELDFLPTMSMEELSNYIEQRKQLHSYKKMCEFFVGMFHIKLIDLFLKIAKVDSKTYAKDVSKRQWQILLKLIKSFFVEIEGTNSFEQAQICAGGVKTSEVNSDTLESLLEDDLYLTGELLDVDGICGGYNLQWAWATGFIAGKNAAKG